MENTCPLLCVAEHHLAKSKVITLSCSYSTGEKKAPLEGNSSDPLYLHLFMSHSLEVPVAHY